jgi:hypothetical protein
MAGTIVTTGITATMVTTVATATIVTAAMTETKKKATQLRGLFHCVRG